MKKTVIFLFVIILSLGYLSSCVAHKAQPTCREILTAMTSAEIILPAGKHYSSTAAEGEDEYLSPLLLSSVFGNGAYPILADGWIDCALYLPYGDHPCEFAVILCKSHDIAEDTAKLFCSRLADLKIAKSSSESTKLLDSAKIAIMNNFVIFIISADAELALKTAKSMIK